MSPLESAIQLNQRSRGQGLGNRLSYSLLSLVVIVDQLLLPMFRVGPVPFKVSYLILVFWLIYLLVPSNNVVSKYNDIRKTFLAFAIILGCILLGELWLTANYNVESYSYTVKNVLTLILAALAFGLGRSSTRFRWEWLLYTLFAAISLNFLFIIFRNNLPSWLISFYYPEHAVSDVIGFQSVADIISLVRPRGLFGNPNASMLMVNLNLLFVYLAIKNKFLEIRSGTTALTLIILPVFLAVSLSSRGEFLVSILLGFLNYNALIGRFSSRFRRVIVLSLILLVAMSAFFLGNLGEDSEFTANANRIYKLSQILDTDQTSYDYDGASNFQRPLIALTTFLGRFPLSPLFGTGISVADSDYLSEGTQYFHNDWMYVLTISGLLGFFGLIWLLRIFVSRIGWSILIPFVIPGLVNTFMLNIPAFISYFLLTGILLASVQQRTASVVLH